MDDPTTPGSFHARTVPDIIRGVSVGSPVRITLLAVRKAIVHEVNQLPYKLLHVCLGGKCINIRYDHYGE